MDKKGCKNEGIGLKIKRKKGQINLYFLAKKEDNKNKQGRTMMKMSKQVKRGEMGLLLALQNLQQRWTHETFKRGWDCWGEYERELAALIPPEAPFVFEKGTKAPFGFIATTGKTRVHFYLRTVGRRQRELVAEPIK